uniref:Uncharacterized protein n=1 Tax=viral metagenome TaxID=1070528 RepID=A0A6C0APV5_9ZZZZ
MDGHNPNASLLAEGGGGRIVAMSGGFRTPIGELNNNGIELEEINRVLEQIQNNERIESLSPIRPDLQTANTALTTAIKNPTTESVTTAKKSLATLSANATKLKSATPSGDRLTLLERLFGAIAVAQRWAGDKLKAPVEEKPVAENVSGTYGIPNSGTDPKGFLLEDLFILKEPIIGTRARKPTYDLTRLPNDANQTLIGHLVNAIQNESVSMKVTVTEPKK